MSLTITDNAISSTLTRHTALSSDGSTWEVSWLPDRKLDRNEATTAMTLAETVATIAADGKPSHTDHPDEWQLVESLAGELGVTAADAVSRLGA